MAKLTTEQMRLATSRKKAEEAPAAAKKRIAAHRPSVASESIREPGEPPILPPDIEIPEIHDTESMHLTNRDIETATAAHDIGSPLPSATAISLGKPLRRRKARHKRGEKKLTKAQSILGQRIQLRRFQVFDMRIRGASYHEISETLLALPDDERKAHAVPRGYDAAAAYVDFRTVTEETMLKMRESTEHLVEVERRRLERVMSRLMDAFEAGALEAANGILATSDRIQRLLGLGKPVAPTTVVNNNVAAVAHASGMRVQIVAPPSNMSSVDWLAQYGNLAEQHDRFLASKMIDIKEDT